MVEDQVAELKRLLPQCLLADWVRLGRRLVRILKDRHHSAQRDALLNRLLQSARASSALRVERQASVPRVDYPPDLPITGRKSEIVEAIRKHPVVVIAGETGSGKTTQLPKMCLEAGLGIEAKIGCTQPRRVAALSISRRIAEELNTNWGAEVGCKIRFDDRSSSRTFIKLMTDGILLAEMQGDPDLSEYSAIIIDEAHERSLNIDFLLGHLKNLLSRRNDLKLLITSATIDTSAFSKHFGDAPIIEVSGRVYPVDLQYQPLDSALEETGDASYIDAAVNATDRIVTGGNHGDVLIFMPSERDIRETTDQLEGRFSSQAEIIPLFGRLSAGDQQRVFSPSPRRKIVVATNIAETSLTIPGIRYVIDSGLARISRYNPRTRTKRLPIEPVSQSSANQRKGRAGRVEAGICIRLFSEEDFDARPPFTQPEILRANLAEVILRMKAFRLGDIETFPFVQPPTPAAIASGYALLQELGALNEARELTPMGDDLARLPIDPTLGRMLLQSQREHATRELLIIAAGLSIQDPRERPLDQKEAAAAAHRAFADPKSDFLSLLNIWNTVHDDWDRLRTQNQRRKFCRQRFLSYLRMREWQDLYAQLHDALDDLGSLRLNESNAAYDAIHRSILAGLVGHVARREERNTYKASGNRKVSLFPGSVLYARGEPVRKPAQKGNKPPPAPKTTQPEWIVAGEIVETSQLFARTLAGVEPQWILDVAPHCCKITHQNPRWEVGARTVLIDEIATLHGLEIHRRKVAFGNINPAQATAIFIRSALVEENLLAKTEEDEDRGQAGRRSAEFPAQYRFLTHNRRIRDKIEAWRTRVRNYALGDLDLEMSAFYARHLTAVSSVHELNRFLREPGAQERLCISETELAGTQTLQFDPVAFPDTVALVGQPAPLSYAYAPGEEHDGVTITLSAAAAQGTPPAALEWAVPGLRQDLVGELLRTLPKALRKELMPLPPKAAEIAAAFQPSTSSLLGDLARFIHRKYGVQIPQDAWSLKVLPAHLLPRIQVLDDRNKAVANGRDLAEIQRKLTSAPVVSTPKGPSPEWAKAMQKWEQFHLTGWTFGDLPQSIAISHDQGLRTHAWPGLESAEGGVNIRLFRTAELCQAASLAGAQRLVEIAIEKDLAWLEKDLKDLSRLRPPSLNVEALRSASLEHLRRYLLPQAPFPALTRAHYEQAVAAAKDRLPGLVVRFIDRLSEISKLLGELQLRSGAAAKPVAVASRTLSSFDQLQKPAAQLPKGPGGLADEMADLPAFLCRTSFERLADLPRFLKAMLVRLERAKVNPGKDQERQTLLNPYIEALKQLTAAKAATPGALQKLEEFRWMIEEYKVSLFAQELGTSIPISPQRLNRALEETREVFLS